MRLAYCRGVVLLRETWAPLLGLSCCRKCKRSNRPHRCQGYCGSCYVTILNVARYKVDEEFRERKKRTAKAHYMANTEAVIERTKQFAKDHPEKKRAYVKASRKRCGKKYGSRYYLGKRIEFMKNGARLVGYVVKEPEKISGHGRGVWMIQVLVGAHGHNVFTRDVLNKRPSAAKAVV